MAGQTQKRTSADRNFVYCPLCYKPQKSITTHLKRVCMKNSSPEERVAELKRAKESTRKWTGKSRTWDYKDLCEIVTHVPSRLRMLKAFKVREFYVTNTPHESEMAILMTFGSETAARSTSAQETASAVPATRSAATPVPSLTVESDSDQTFFSREQTRDPSCQKDGPAVPTSVRIKMKEAGMYKKFPDHAKLLVDFKKYLRESLKVPHCQQEIDNVSRFLRYLQPCGNEPSLDFLTKSTETQDFLMSLKHTEMTAATILYYIKNILRFVDYLKTRLDLEKKEPQLHLRCQTFKEMLQTLRKPISRAHSQEVCKTRYKQFVEGTRSLRDCQTILRVAKADFLDIFGKTVTDDAVSGSEKTMYRYYCEAVLVLRHFQRPGAVEGLTVTEWVNRKSAGGRFVIGICQHKTAAMQIATFALTQDEEAWIQLYYVKIRPRYLVGRCEKFFIASNGKPVNSVTNDLNRLHNNYRLKTVTSQEVRRAAETESAAAFTEHQKENVAHYLAHTTAVARSHYRMRVPEAVAATATLLDSLVDCSPEDTPGPSRTTPPAVQHSTKDFADFLVAFPVSTNGLPPNKSARVDAGFSSNRVHYDQWRNQQFNMRQEYLLSCFTHQKPTVARVSMLIKKEGWRSNHPTPGTVVQLWKPASKAKVENCPAILESVSTQKWKGLAIKHFGPRLGVVAAHHFSKGDIVCDYHGQVITGEEGRAMMEGMVNDPGYLFFFKAGERELCIDSQTFPCECHPNVDTFGRRINHSGKNPNLKAVNCVLKVDGQDKDVILFRALTNLSVDAELKFDYGVSKGTFKGEGLNLEWFDE